MCGGLAQAPRRIAPERRPAPALFALLADWSEQFNVRPMKTAGILRAEDGEIIGDRVRCWLTPRWSQTERFPYSTFNARAETVQTARSFRDSSATGARSCRLTAISSGTGDKRHPPQLYGAIDSPKVASRSGGEMARIALAFCIGLVAFAITASAVGQVRVRGYLRKDGTYVAPHYRSAPNRTKDDNYSTRGNYNPYTGEAGKTRPDYESTYVPPSYYTPAIRNENPPIAAPEIQYYTVYRCIDAAGNLNYLSYPRAGCDEILVSAQPQPSNLRPLRSPRFGGYECTSDCSGHRAGYEWAQARGIESPDDCSGRSQSFIEGCQAYAEEQSQAGDD